MVGGAAGGFVTRAFESMLKECSGKKHPQLQKAIQSYLDGLNEVNQVQPASSTHGNQDPAADSDSSSLEAGAAETLTEPNQSKTELQGEQGADVSKTVNASGTISTVLATSGHTLEGAGAELVLNPL